MAEELAFARKASGLVRGLSMWDAFFVGFANQGVTPSLVVLTSLGVGVYTGGNMIIAVLLSVLLCGIGFPLVWGVLGGSMPRSGGEYIYNSRIIHPIVGLGESFGNAVVQLMWIYVLAPWMADPGLVMLGEFMGWPWLVDFASSRGGVFAVATATSIVAFCFVAFGIKIYARAQKIVMFIGMGGCVVICVALSWYGKADFIAGWNAMAAQYGSLDYNAFLSAVNTAAGEAMPTTWNWYDSLGVMVAGSWLFAYSYCITYIAGEVKRPDKSIMLANLFAILVPGFFALWTAIAIYHMIPFDFFSATQWAATNGVPEGYSMPWGTNYVQLLGFVNSNKLLLLIAVMSFLAFDLWWVCISYLAFPRMIFAWGMDRMGPKWFTSVNPRFASPIKNHVLCFILGEIGIALYVFWTNNPIAGLAVTALEIFSVFGVTAFAAAIFPFVKKTRSIWESSPYHRWRIAGIPVVTLGALVQFVYLGILTYFFFLAPVNLEGFSLNAGLVIAITWALGIVWYFAWSWRRKTTGVDMSMTYGQLPPE